MAGKGDQVFVLIHGRGGELGDFKIFSDSLKKEILLREKPAAIVQRHVSRRQAFLELFMTWPPAQKIKELHIFAHSIGAGLFFGYGDPILERDRQQLLASVAARGQSRPTFDEVRKTEEGAVLTDDLVVPPFSASQAAIKKLFAPAASAKIWGCNAGVSGWIYTDYSTSGRWVADPADVTAPYYWRALNEQNQPKPSVAKAFADYFGVVVHGAQTGANIHVYDAKTGTWLSTSEYQKNYRKPPSGTLPHRLVPEAGGYRGYAPETQ